MGRSRASANGCALIKLMGSGQQWRVIAGTTVAHELYGTVRHHPDTHVRISSLLYFIVSFLPACRSERETTRDVVCPPNVNLESVLQDPNYI